MNNKGQNQFVDKKGAADLLNTDVEQIDRWVDEGIIPYCKFPNGEIKFWPESLINWGLSYQVAPGYKIKTSSNIEDQGHSLIAEVCKRFKYETRKSKEYINLCFAQRAFAQLHPRWDNDGIDLVLRECGEDSNLPKCTFERTELEQLNGYTKTNKNWLKGTQHTEQPAVAFHIPNSILDDSDGKEWKDIQTLLEYTRDKLEKHLRAKNLLRTRKLDL